MHSHAHEHRISIWCRNEEKALRVWIAEHQQRQQQKEACDEIRTQLIQLNFTVEERN